LKLGIRTNLRRTQQPCSQEEGGAKSNRRGKEGTKEREKVEEERNSAKKVDLVYAERGPGEKNLSTEKNGGDQEGGSRMGDRCVGGENRTEQTLSIKRDGKKVCVGTDFHQEKGQRIPNSWGGACLRGPFQERMRGGTKTRSNNTGGERE